MEKEQLLEKWQGVLPTLNEDGLAILDRFIGNIAGGDDRFTTTDTERLKRYREMEDKREAANEAFFAELRQEAEEREEWEREKKTFEAVPLYQRNATMAMIGQQSIAMILSDKEAGKEFNDLVAAHKYDFSFDNATDGFLLGFIWGKRKERARKKAKAAERG